MYSINFKQVNYNPGIFEVFWMLWFALTSVGEFHQVTCKNTILEYLDISCGEINCSFSLTIDILCVTKLFHLISIFTKVHHSL